MPRVTKNVFYECTVSAFPNLLTKSLPEILGPGETPIQYIVKKVCEIKDFTAKLGKAEFAIKFRDLLYSDGVLIGSIVRQVKQTIREDDGEHISDTLIDDNPPLYFVLHEGRQLLYIDKRSDSRLKITFKNLTKILGDIFTSITERKYNVFVERLPQKGRFWDAINKSEKLKSVEFQYLAPNIAGRTSQEMREALKAMQENQNITGYSERYSNRGGDLVIKETDAVLQEKVKTVEMQGGEWVISNERGRVRSSDQFVLLGTEDLGEIFGFDVLKSIK